MMKKLMALLTAALMLAVMLPLTASAETYPTPEGYNDNDYQKLVTFFEIENEDGVKNGVSAFGDDYDPADPEKWEDGHKSIEWTDVDGELRVVSIDISWSSLYGALDFSGCTALEYLDCEQNNLTELDVSGCTALESLNCGRNNLTELDLTHNSALEYLDCYYNNFTELDLTHNTALDYLDCSSSSLTELDVSGCTALRTLGCSGNSFTELDVSGCTALETLLCDENNLTELDVTQNTALVSLSCSVNNLTELDVSGCTALAMLWCDGNKLAELNVSGCTALEYLDCEQNNITELDVSGCTALRFLRCSDSSIIELDVSGCTALRTLYCSGNSFTELDVTQNTELGSFECFGNNLTELDVTQNTELNSLYCGRNNLTELDVTKNTKLWRLDCSGNNITELDLTNQTELQYLYSSSTIENIEFIWFGTQYHVYAEGNGYVEINGSAEENQDFEMEEILMASAEPMDGYAFLGWYDAEGNLVSTEDEIDLLTIGETTLEARFEETEDPTDPTDPEGDISAEANEYGEVQYVHNEEDDSLTLNMTASDEAYGVRNIYINGVLVATTSEDTYVIDNISSYADENGNIEIYVEFAQSEGGEEPIDPDDPPKTGTDSMVGMAIALMLIGAAIVLIRRRQTAR